MKQTEYLNGVLNYYRECDITPGDPNEGRWENAHTPYPKGMGESTCLLLHEHHVIHDLWQSDELEEPHFFPPHVEKILNQPDYWPTRWFELWDTFDHQLHLYKVKGGKVAGKIGGKIVGRRHVESGHLQSISSKGGRAGGKIGGKTGSKKTNSQRWECLVTGYQSSPGPLTRYQQKRGIDTKLRKQIK